MSEEHAHDDAYLTDCLFVGGVADGHIQKVDVRQTGIRVQQETHLKPLASSGQVEPEAAVLVGDYAIHPFELHDDPGSSSPIVLCLAVPMGTLLSQGFGQMIGAYRYAVVKALLPKAGGK